MRTLESYKEKTNKNSVLILTTDSDFYQYIKQASPEEKSFGGGIEKEANKGGKGLMRHFFITHVTGSQVIVGDEPFMLATTVKRGNEVLRLRDKDGNPEWLGWKTTE